MHVLEEGERCEMNGGYQGSVPMYAKCPGVIEADPEKAEMQQRVRNRQERANKWFKIGRFCPPLIATSCVSTRQFLVPLLSLLSFRLQKTHSSK
jgi:hypothetical protein